VIFTCEQVVRLERVYASLGVWPLRYASTTRLLARRLGGYGMSPEASRKRLWRDVVSYAQWCNDNASSPGAAFCQGVSRMPSQPSPGSQHEDAMSKSEDRRGAPLDDWVQQQGVAAMDFVKGLEI
jgi:hypothetical protein